MRELAEPAFRGETLPEIAPAKRSPDLRNQAMRAFLNAADPREIVFVRGATEGINLVAQSWGATFLRAGDEVLISELEHHSNIVPWQLLRDRIGIRLVIADAAQNAAQMGPRDADGAADRERHGNHLEGRDRPRRHRQGRKRAPQGDGGKARGHRAASVGLGN